MRREYDFREAQRNPYARRMKRQVAVRLDEQTIEYFRHLAGETGIAYQADQPLPSGLRRFRKAALNELAGAREEVQRPTPRCSRRPLRVRGSARIVGSQALLSAP